MTSFLKARVLREGAWVAAGQVLSASAALISIRIMTELLPPEQFGRLTLLVGAAALALGLVSTPRLQAVIRYYPEWRMSGRLNLLRATASSLINSLVIATVLLIAVGGGLASLFSDQNWYLGLLVGALLAVDAQRSFELAFLNAARRQRSVALVQVADAWARPMLAILVVLLFDRSAEAALAGYIVGSFIVLAMMRMMTRLEGQDSGQHPSQADDSHLQSNLSLSIRRYALPLVPMAIFAWLSGMGDRYVIAGLMSMDDVGLYAAAYGLASRPFIMLSTIVEQTARPILQNKIAEGDQQGIDSIKRRMIIMSVLGAAIGVLCFISLDDIVTYLFLAEEYQRAAKLMSWIVVGYAFLAVSSVYSRFCYAFDATGSVLILTVAGTLIGLAVLVPAAILYGLTGAVAAVPVRFAIELILSIILSHRAEKKFHFNGKAYQNVYQ